MAKRRTKADLERELAKCQSALRKSQINVQMLEEELEGAKNLLANTQAHRDGYRTTLHDVEDIPEIKSQQASQLYPDQCGLDIRVGRAIKNAYESGKGIANSANSDKAKALGSLRTVNALLTSVVDLIDGAAVRRVVQEAITLIYEAVPDTLYSIDSPSGHTFYRNP